MTKLTKTEEQEALNTLRELCPEGTTIYVILLSVSKSGMSRKIDLVSMRPEGPRYLTGLCAKLRIAGMTQTKEAWARSEGATIRGCGMDMGFHAVSSLSRRLYDDDYALKHQWT